MRRTSIHSKHALALLIASAGASACGAQDRSDGQQAELGALGLAIALEEYTVSEVTLSVVSERLDPEVRRERTFTVADPNAAISASQHGLPAGDYSVAVRASVTDDPSTPDVDESEIPCFGAQSGITVVPGETTVVEQLVLTCTVDGGQVQLAGGISVEAKVELETVNACPDLIRDAFVAPLDASVEAPVQLFAEQQAGATVTWTASAGEISADDASYSCPDVAGVYTVEARFVRGDCEQVFTEQVSCHESYQGPVAPLPDAFIFTGSCDLPSPCHLTSEGGAWRAVCGSRPNRLTVLQGEASAENQFPFLMPDGSRCSGEVIDGELVGSCSSAAGDSCVFASDSRPNPSPFCPVINELDQVSICDQTYDSCEVIQHGCDMLAKCGDAYLGRSVGADGSIRVEAYSDETLLRCETTTHDGVASGSCAQRGGAGEGVTCEFAAGVVEAPSACEETLPRSGFVLEGCGFDDACIAVQTGCAWQLVCAGGSYAGIATTTDRFEFTGPNGEACSAGTSGGELTGSCGSGEAACSFGVVEPRVESRCLQLPAELTARGCGFGSPTAVDVIQHGCTFLGYAPSRGDFVSGAVSENGIAFPGISEGWQCSAELDEQSGGELWGGCSRDNDDGSVSLCHDFTDEQGARLVIQL